MSNEQKLREASKQAIDAFEAFGEAGEDDFNALFYLTQKINALQEALATTEPEPTGMPELHPVAHIELGDDSHDVVTLEAAKTYGEQCWKAGYKHGAWADKPEPTSKQPLQVDPAVNQQLTTEPVDEREVFTNDTKDAKRYRWLASSESVAMNAKSKDHQWAISDAWTTLEKLDADKALIDAAIDAAMAKGVK